jgi:hypothetical protein
MNGATKTVAFAIIAIGLAGVPAVLAQHQQAPEAEAPAAKPDDMQDMMQGGDMMGMMNMMKQMNEMMGACTKMMQAMTTGEKTPGEGEEPGNPG